MNYGSGTGIPVTGYGVCGFGYSMGKSHPQYTCVQPYVSKCSEHDTCNTIIARDMQNLRQIMHISPEAQHNLIGSFATDNHRCHLLWCKFYLRIVKVVIVAEQICVNESKNQGFAKKYHTQSQLPIQILLSIAWCVCNMEEYLCQSFNLQACLSHFHTSDQRCISLGPHGLADAFRLTL